MKITSQKLKVLSVWCVSLALFASLTGCCSQRELGPCGDPNKVRFNT